MVYFIDANGQRAMPPGMMQQMQRQLRSGGGMQDMMKAMMQGQGGDQLDMEEMQSILILTLLSLPFLIASVRDDGPDGQQRPGRIGWTCGDGQGHAQYWRHVQDDGHGQRRWSLTIHTILIGQFVLGSMYICIHHMAPLVRFCSLN